MNKKRWLFRLKAVVLIAFFLLDTSITFINSYDTKANLVAVDNFSNFFSASNNGVLKFSPDGKFLCRYEEFRYGKIGMVDVNNPLKILVFYPDFMTAIILDRFLAPLNRYNFFEFGYQNITAIASSTDGRIWFYDNVDFKLKKINESGKVFLESQPLNVLLEKAPNPTFMMENNNKVYMTDTSLGILVFDIFGSYSKTIPLKGLRRFQVLQDEIVFFQGKELYSYNTMTLETKSLSLPDTTVFTQAVLSKDRMAILKQDHIDFYKY